MNLTKPPRLAVVPTGTTTDYSGAHTGFDIAAVPANPNRIGLIFSNPSNVWQYYINFGAVAGWGGTNSIILYTDSTLILTGALPSEEIHVVGIFANDYTIKEIT